MPSSNELLLYQTEDGETRIEVLLENETVWLTQAQMSELFQTERSVITRHIRNVFREGELNEESNVQKMHSATSTKPILIYNLDVIISVGYRVNSHRGTQFRIWATRQLREYIVKGFVINDDRLGNERSNYFDELVERVRRIRTSEANFYEKVRSIFSTSNPTPKPGMISGTWSAARTAEAGSRGRSCKNPRCKLRPNSHPMAVTWPTCRTTQGSQKSMYSRFPRVAAR